MSRLARSATALTGAVMTTISVVIAAVFILSFVGFARFVPVLSDSMAPDMPKGSLAVMRPMPQDSVTAGDVIVFTAPDGSHRRVIHRVQHVYGVEEAEQIRNWTADRAFLLTKGDNNAQADPWLLTLGDDTLWKQASVAPMLGWPAIWFSDPLSRVIAFMLGGAAVAGWALVLIWRRDGDGHSLPIAAVASIDHSRTDPH